MSKEKIAETIFECNRNVSVKICDCILPMCDCQDNYNPIEQGVCILQLAEFCKKMRLNLKCLDADEKIFYSYISPKVRKGVPCIMIMIENGHVYPVIDKQLRKSIQNSGKGYSSVHKNLIKKKEKDEIEAHEQTTKLSKQIIDDIPENSSIFVTDDTMVENLFIDYYLNHNEQYKYQIISNRMVQLNLSDGKVVYHNQDYKTVLQLCEKLGLEFKNQSLTSIGLDIYKDNEGVPLKHFASFFNDDTKRFSELAYRGNWTTTYDIPESKNNLKGYDINKCYSSILGDSDATWIAMDVNDEIQEYTGQNIEYNCLYYVQTECMILLQGNGVYYPKIVEKALEDNLITKANIKYFIRCTRSTELTFKNFVDKVFDTCGKNAKHIINRFIGSCLGKSMKTIGKRKYTNNLESACTAFFNPDQEKQSSVFIRESGEKRLYCIDDTKITPIENQTFLIHAQIVQTGWLRVYEMYKKCGGKLIQVKTDAIIVDPERELTLSKEIGGYKKERVSDSMIEKLRVNLDVKKKMSDERIFKMDKKEFTHIKLIDEYDMNEFIHKLSGKNVLLQGEGGVGKTHALRAYIKKMEEQGKTVLKSAYTHVAKNC